MKRVLNKFRGGEKGQALMLVLILMLLGGLIIAPVLAYVGTGLKVGKEVHEERMAELYAADAGVEDASWQIIAGAPEVPEQGDPSWDYDIDMNDKDVDITIDYIEGGESIYELTYKITSTGTSDDGSSTTIESYVELVAAFRYLFDNAITSPGDVILKPGTTITGKVQYNGNLDDSDGKATITGEIIDDPIRIWPEAESLIAFYSNEDHLGGASPVPDGYQINVTGCTKDNPYPIPALYAQGSVTIKGNGWAELTGTVYVTTDLTVMPNCGVILNGEAMFAEGDIWWKPGSMLSGSGCIVAVRDLKFQPNMESKEGDYVFLLSVEGNGILKPNGDFYGSTAGNMMVEVQSNFVFEWVPYDPDNLDFPMWAPPPSDGSGGNELLIHTWEISLQQED